MVSPPAAGGSASAGRTIGYPLQGRDEKGRFMGVRTAASVLTGQEGKIMLTTPRHAGMANAVRALAMDAVQKARSGHPGMPMGMADVATVLFTRFLKFDPKRPDWPDRDRFVLSAGHGSMLLYALLYLTGYEDMTIEQIKSFRQLGSRTAGHPEYGHARGIETTTGPLGQGLGNAVGMALAERLLAARYGEDLVDHHTYVIASDGDIMEGVGQEAISLAGHLRLSKLVVLLDDNGISIDGATSLAISDDYPARFAASGWHVQTVDGHDPDAIAAAIAAARDSDRPAMVACRTTIGFGAPNKAGSAATHGSPLGEEEIAGAREALSWPYPSFEIPDHILEAWRAAGEAGAARSAAWDDRLAALDRAERAQFEQQYSGELGEAWKAALDEHIEKLALEAPKIATRAASKAALDVLARHVPSLVSGSADLTGSNLTKADVQEAVAPGTYRGSYVHYGVREHAMAAAMNGLALHGGCVPYGGTFLVFSDYCRPSIRLAALMGLRVVYVMTHDSIGLGEDGPTHQPIEHLAALRAIPNLQVFRPADAVETAESWAIALESQGRPSVLALSRQSVPAVRTEASTENLTAHGAYILAPAAGRRQVTLLATGSEVSLALKAQALLHEMDVPTAVVSMPCWELFEEQPAHYRDEVLGPSTLRVGIEAASPFGWGHYLEPDDAFVGMTGFGASGPYEELYRHFGITPERVVEEVKARL
jgi:transketolase